MSCRLLCLTGAALLGLSLASAPAQAQTLNDTASVPVPVPVSLNETNTAGLGFAPRVERSPYLGAGSRFDVLPLYLYEGEKLYLHADRIGLKLLAPSTQRLDLVVERRLEGFPLSHAPASLQGMATRNSAVDMGLSFSSRQSAGLVTAEVVQDISQTHKGTELRLGLSREQRAGAWTLRPSVGLAWRSARLNNYYYGVQGSEATATRAAYAPGAGVEATLGLHASYALTPHLQLLSGVAVTRLPRSVSQSPIVQQRVLPSFYVGAAYNFGRYDSAGTGTSTPTYFKLLHGKATEDGCHMLKIITAQCLSTASVNPTSVTAVQFGRPFVENFLGWPVDMVGYVGLAHHDDHGLQANGLQLDLFMKAYYRGFPWQSRLKTRLGMGMGVSLAQRVPYVEVSSQAANGEQTSRLLHHLDPTLDVSLGDLIGSRAWKDTYIGMGVSHRSGIFKSSRLLGNVNGGSNYIYSYVETVY